MRPRRARLAFAQSATGQRRHKPDYVLVLLSAILLVVGLIVVYAISPGLAAQKNVSENYYVSKQITAILLGLITFGIISQIPLSVWHRLQKPLIVAAGLATALALILPTTVEYPAHRWIRFGGLSLQSVEVIKFALIICLAAFIAGRIKEGSIADAKRTLNPLLIIIGITAFVVGVLQRDLGSMGVLIAMMTAVAFVAGFPLKRIGLAVALFFIGLVLLILPFSYRRDRVLTFLNPERDCLNAGYQACQALIAVGSGGITGKGLAHSGQAYGYVPEAANDSIFAIMAEKFGFVGTTLLLILFGALFARLKHILERAPDDFSRLIVVAVLAWLSTQAIINIGAMLGLLPLKGITLPFISYGGTSVIFVMAAIGLVFNISRYTTYGVSADKEGKRYESATDWRGNRRTHYAAVSRRP